jgi:trk system potassium uptake protein
VNVLVLGCGTVGAGVARELTSRGVTVVVVDHDADVLARLRGIPGRRIRGSVLHHPVLVDAGIERADAVAVVTGHDRVNAVVALAARRTFRVPTVVARIYDPRTAAILQRLGVRTLAPVTWGVQRIAELVTASSLQPTATLGGGGVEIVEAHIPALLDGRPAEELEVAGELQVVAVTHRGRTVLATPATRLTAGDLAHIAVNAAALGRLEALLGTHLEPR